MKTLTYLLVALSCVFTGHLAVAEGETQPEVTVTSLKGSLHLLRGRGGNVVASVGTDGILMIDDDYTEYAGAHHAALRGLAGEASVPTFVIQKR